MNLTTSWPIGLFTMMFMAQPNLSAATQDPATTSTAAAADPRTEQLKKQLEELEIAVKIQTAQTAIAEAQKKEREASIPAVTTPGGTTSIDDRMAVEVQIVTHRALAEIAGAIAEKVAGCVQQYGGDSCNGPVTHSAQPPTLAGQPKPVVVILDQEARRLLVEYRAVAGVVGNLLERYSDLDKQWDPDTAPVAAVATVGSALQQALGLLSFFRQDTSYFGRDVKTSEFTLQSLIAGGIGARATVLWPTRVGWQVSGGAIRPTNTGLPLSELAARRAATARRLAEHAGRLAKVTAEIAEVEAAIKSSGGTEEETKRRQTLRNRKAELDAKAPLVEAYSSLLKSTDEALIGLSKTSVGDQVSSIERLQTTAWLLARIGEAKDKGTFFLASETVVSGGSYRTRKNLFTTLFSGDLLSYSGGAAVSFVLFDEHGRVALADTFSTFSGFGKFKKRDRRFAGDNW